MSSLNDEIIKIMMSPKKAAEGPGPVLLDFDPTDNKLTVVVDKDQTLRVATGFEWYGPFPGRNGAPFRARPVYYYHRTTKSKARRVLERGFISKDDCVMVTDIKPQMAEWKERVPIVEVATDLSTEEMNRFERKGKALNHREWRIPFDILNPKVRVRIWAPSLWVDV